MSIIIVLVCPPSRCLQHAAKFCRAVSAAVLYLQQQVIFCCGRLPSCDMFVFVGLYVIVCFADIGSPTCIDSLVWFHCVCFLTPRFHFSSVRFHCVCLLVPILFIGAVSLCVFLAPIFRMEYLTFCLCHGTFFFGAQRKVFFVLCLFIEGQKFVGEIV